MTLKKADASPCLAPQKKSVKDQYFFLVLNTCYENGYFEEPDMMKIHTEIAELLQGLIRRFTYGDSSSIKNETAYRLMHSILYVLDTFAASLEDPTELASIVRRNGIHKVYSLGMDLVRNHIAYAHKLYAELSAHKLNLPVEVYNDTINLSLPDFFQTYDVTFNAHDNAASIDYPLVFDDMDQKGVGYIIQYMEKLLLENLFCHCFDTKEILTLLKGYGEKFHLDFRCAPFNIFEVVFAQTIFSLLCSPEKPQLFITAGEFEQLVIKLSGQSSGNIRLLLEHAADKMITILKLQNSELIEYLRRYKKQFIPRFLTAHVHGNLINMLVIDEPKLPAEKHSFTDGRRMSDRDFNRLIAQLQDAKELKEKIQIISRQVRSLEDYIDLLGSDCLYGKEYRAVFELLQDAELAVLGKTISQGSAIDMTPIFLENLTRMQNNCLLDWQVEYINYLANMKGRSRVINYMNKIHTVLTDN